MVTGNIRELEAYRYDGVPLTGDGMNGEKEFVFLVT